MNSLTHVRKVELKQGGPNYERTHQDDWLQRIHRDKSPTEAHHAREASGAEGGHLIAG